MRKWFRQKPSRSNVPVSLTLEHILTCGYFLPQVARICFGTPGSWDYEPYMDNPEKSRFRRLITLLFGGSEQFSKNVIWLASSNALGQIASLLALPLLTRLFTPQDFGIFAIFVAVQSIILAVATGRFEWLIPNARSAREVALLLGLGLVTLSGCTILVLGALAFDTSRLAKLVGFSPEYAQFLWLMPLTVLVGGTQLLLEAWHVYRKTVQSLGHAKLILTLITILASTGAGFLAMGAPGLILGYFFGFLFSCASLMLNQKRMLLGLLSLKYDALAHGIARYRTAVFQSLGVSLVNVSMSMSMTLLISVYYDARTVGWYSLVFRVATGPVALFTSAIIYSFWSEAAALAKTSARDLRRFYVQSVARLALMSVPLAILALFAPYYVGPVFGEAEWAGAGWLLAAITPYLVGILIISPTTHLIVYGRQNWQFWCDLATLCCVVILFHVMAQHGFSATQTVAATSCVMLAGYIVRFFLHLRANSLLRIEQGIASNDSNRV
jgi:O-antigen/teichoic acid export membrane protein